MVILHQLLREHPELEEGMIQNCISILRHVFLITLKMFCVSKKVRNVVLIGMSYEEVGEIEHCLSSGGMQLDEYILFRGSLLAYKQGLSTEKQELFERLVAGEHFLGRQNVC